MSDAAIILAGGSGSRMRGTVKDKVLVRLFGLPVILHSFRAFLRSGVIGEVVFVCRDDEQISKIQSGIKRHFAKSAEKIKISFTYGGKERADSVINGLSAVSDKKGLAFIHDGARPLVGEENIKKLSQTAHRDGAAVLASRVVDTIKRVAGSAENLSSCELEDLDRSRLWAMQTPQVFCADFILKAYKSARRKKIKLTDDVAAAASAGVGVSVVENITPNPKITVPEDLAFIEFLNKDKK